LMLIDPFGSLPPHIHLHSSIFFSQSHVELLYLPSFPTRALPISFSEFPRRFRQRKRRLHQHQPAASRQFAVQRWVQCSAGSANRDRKSTRLNSSHGSISYAVFCLKKKINTGDNKAE